MYLFEKNIGKNFRFMVGQRVLRPNTKNVIHKKEKLINWTSSILKSLALQRPRWRRWKRELQTQKIFTSHISDKRLVSRIYKELSKLNSKNTSTQIRKWAKDMKNQSTKYIQMAKMHMKRCSTSLAIRDMKIKNSMRYWYTTIRLYK